jgi:hypothetical protein
MTLLRPDPTVPHTRPDIKWCQPVGDYDFKKLIMLAEKFKGVTPQGMRYLRRIGQRREPIVLVMSPQAGCTLSGTGEHELPFLTMEEIEAECAWLRLCKDIRQPIFVIPSGRPADWYEMEPLPFMIGEMFVADLTED